MMRFLVLLVPIFACIITAPQVQAGSVQCTCPEIKADGVGNSSCSAAETENRCTVDFNEFGDDEEAAATGFANELASRYGLEIDPGALFQSVQSFDPDVARALDSSTLVVQVFSYALVALSQTEESFWILEDPEFGEALSTLVSNQDSVASAFKGDGQYGSPDERVYVSPGCLQIKTGSGFWVMYKAFWAQSARSPQCVP